MSSGGFPQLDPSSYPSQVFWLGVSFALLYALMSRLALPRVGGVIERRRALRADNLAAAESTNTEAEKIKSAFEKSLGDAQRKASEALTAAERAVSAKVSDEQSAFADSARKRLAAAEQTIARAKTDALASLSDIAADIAADMAKKAGGIDVSKADAQKAVAAALKEAA